MDWLPTLDRIQAWHWWVLGALLLILEVAAPGIFFVWLALSAFTMGLLVFVLPLPVAVQVLLFALLSVAAVLLGRRYITRLLPDSPEAGRVNRGSSRLVGQTVTVVTPIVNGMGRVRVGDSEWRATGPDTPQGARVVVVAAEGPTLHVREVKGTWT
ncbi:NfeD family protein [Deinococcus taeanensis]|uniref:NfeD family protein n=1 Tax=Deinococcus taeanensis TaxID=2737050 RepID=UPI001CDBA40C|nr:NfeD family protein [Deinococcus taeanensis]UBV41826.1 NfeD family protein [Deinococcus taeanensis]